MGSITEANKKECELDSAHLPSIENGHQFIPATRRPGIESSFTRICSKEFSESDPLLLNAGTKLGQHQDNIGTTSASWTISQDEPQNFHGQEMPSESIWAMVIQILVPFFLAGFGMVLAGMLLDLVQVSVGDDLGWMFGIFDYKLLSCVYKLALGRFHYCDRDLHTCPTFTGPKGEPGDDNGIKTLHRCKITMLSIYLLNPTGPAFIFSLVYAGFVPI